MQTIQKTFEVFDFDELNEKVQEKVIQKYLEDDDYDWQNWHDSLTAFDGLFPSGVSLYFNSISFERRDFSYKIGIEDDSIAGLTGVRLWKWLINHDIHRITTKYKTGKKALRKNGWTKNLEIFRPLKVVNLCKKDAELESMSDYWTDFAVLQVLQEFLQKPNKNMTLQDLLENTAQNVIKVLIKEGEHFYSEKRVKEEIVNNELKFLADGVIFH